MNSKATNRSSGIELLRIMSMLAIVAYHYVYWGGFNEFSTYRFGASVFFLQILSLPGRLCCAIFAIISGYYLSQKDSFGWKHYRKTVIVSAQMVFYYIVVLSVFILFKMIPVSKKEILMSLFSPVYGTWFAANYILLLVTAPFLNKFIKCLSKKDFIILLGVLFVIWSVIPTFFAPTFITTGNYDYGSLDFFIVTYLIGAFIRLHIVDNVRYKNRWNLILALLSYSLLVVSVIAVDFLALKFNPAWMNKATYFNKYYSPFSIGVAVFSVLFFLNMKIYNRFINKIASTTFGIYLLHNNFIFRRYIWQSLFPNADYADFPYFHVLIKVLIVFSVCAVLEYLRKHTIERIFYNTCMKKLDAFADHL